MEISVRKNDQSRSEKDIRAWGSLTWLANGKLGNAQGITVGRVIIRKGQSNPLHAHDNSEEVLYLLTGRLEHRVGHEKVILEPGDTVTIPAGIEHNALSIGDQDADMMVVYASAQREIRDV